MLLPFEISRVKNIIAGTKDLLSFIDDGSCSDTLLDSINRWIETIKANKFEQEGKDQINDFFDYCIEELKSKRSLLKMRLHLDIPAYISRKLYMNTDVQRMIEGLKLHLTTKQDLSNYLHSLDHESLLFSLSLVYFGRDGILVDVPHYEEMNGEEYMQEKIRLTTFIDKGSLLENKMNELDKTFESDSLIINQIVGKFLKLEDYFDNCESLFIY